MTSEKTPFSPDDRARIIRDKREIENPEIAAPQEGDIVERNGEKIQFVKVPTGEKVWDTDTQSLIPGYHSLKTWFSHHTEKIGPGPGWDNRITLTNLSPEEMLQRYGHVFTRDEIFSPGGKWEVDESGEEKLTGGMPDYVPYYDLEPVETHDSDIQQ